MRLTRHHFRAIGAAIRELVPALTSRARYVATDATGAVLVDPEGLGMGWTRLRVGMELPDVTNPVLVIRSGSWSFVIKLTPSPAKARVLGCRVWDR